MTRRDTLNCVHEPFGDAFYFGPERLSKRYENDEKERVASGFSDSTYKTVMDRIDREAAEVRPYPFFSLPLHAVLFPVMTSSCCTCHPKIPNDLAFTSTLILNSPGHLISSNCTCSRVYKTHPIELESTITYFIFRLLALSSCASL